MTTRLKHSMAAAGLALGLTAASLAQAATTTVKIIGFNDFHGNINSPGTFSGSPSGGADYLAGYIANLKSQNPNTVVVEAGDVIGASPLVSAFYHDEGTIEVLNRAGLNIASVGNHEFDEGSTELLRMQKGGCHPTDTANTCKGASVGTPVPFEGAKFKYTSANVTVDATGKTLFPPYVIKTFGGVRVGFIGMTLKDTPSIVTPTGVAGLTFTDEVATVNSLIPQLRGMGVEAIVVVVHQGGFQGSDSPNFINDCSLTTGGVDSGSALAPLRGIVAGLDDSVDLVISGHTHTGYNCRLPTKNPNHLIPVTQASNYGRVLTDINMTIDNTTGDVTAITANNIIVSRSNSAITPNAQIASIVSGYNTLVSPLANQVIGTITAALTPTANTDGEMTAGDLIADAQLATSSAPANGSAVVAFMNAGGVRSPGFVASSYPHDVTYSEAFTVQPFGNSLVTMTLTAQQIKDVLEQQFVGCLGQTNQRIMQVSNGLKYTWSASAAPCSKIVDVTLNGTQLVSSGVVLAPTSTYRVQCNNFMSTGGDGFSVFVQGQDKIGGALDLDALVAYFANYLSPNPPYDPTSAALNLPRIKKVP